MEGQDACSADIWGLRCKTELLTLRERARERDRQRESHMTVPTGCASGPRCQSGRVSFLQDSLCSNSSLNNKKCVSLPKLAPSDVLTPRWEPSFRDAPVKRCVERCPAWKSTSQTLTEAASAPGVCCCHRRCF